VDSSLAETLGEVTFSGEMPVQVLDNNISPVTPSYEDVPVSDWFIHVVPCRS